MSAYVLSETSRGVATLRLNTPSRLNVLGSGPGSNREALLQALCAADKDSAVGCMVIAANGASFCGGGDLTGGKQRETALDDYLFLQDVERFHTGLRALHKPVIAAVHGLCLGAGLALIAQCDLVIASEDARFGLVEGRIGLSGASPLVGSIGAMWAKYLILTGEMIDAQRAQRIGLVLEVIASAELGSRVHELAQRIASLPRDAALLNKAGIHAQAHAAGGSAARSAALASDALTTVMARTARAPDGRVFKDIVREEGIEGLKRAREQQYKTPWLVPSRKTDP